MMEEKKTIPKRQARVKGTVLFTVVSVMMVMIVFLFAALALAVTASNRSHNTFQKKQTETTARAVLEAALDAINNDTTTSGLKAQVHGLALGSSVDIPVERSDVSYVKRDASGNLIKDKVTVKNVAEEKYYDSTIDPTTGAAYGWQKYNIYQLSTTIQTANDNPATETTYTVRITAQKKDGSPNPGPGFISMGPAGFPDGGIVMGGATAGLTSSGNEQFNIQNTNFLIESNVYVKGNLHIENTGTIRFLGVNLDTASQVFPNTFFAVTGTLDYGNNITIDTSALDWSNGDVIPVDKVPCVYAGEKLTFLRNNTFDIRGSQPFNIYCGSFEMNPANFLMNGDIYAFNPDATSKLNSVNSTTLYQWSSKNIAGLDANYEFGNLYSKGSVELNGNPIVINGDLSVEKNATLSNVTVKGDIICGPFAIEDIFDFHV